MAPDSVAPLDTATLIFFFLPILEVGAEFRVTGPVFMEMENLGQPLTSQAC